MRYQIRHALVQYGAETIIEDVNFDIHDHEKIAIVGRNGCGKTTLLKLIAGDITMANIDSDETCGISMAGSQKIGYLRQISFEDQEISVENEILKVFEPVFACERRMKELTDELNEKFPELLEGRDTELEEVYYKIQKEIVRKWLIEDHKRVDGRKIDEIRPLASVATSFKSLKFRRRFNKSKSLLFNILYIVIILFSSSNVTFPSNPSTDTGFGTV